MSDHYDIDDNSELKSLARTLTGYDTSTLGTNDMDDLVQVSKLILVNETEVDTSKSDPFYSDDGLSQALLFTVCIHAKGEVENVSVDSWDVGDVFIETRRAGDDEQAQFQKWAQLVADGIEASEVETDEPLPKISNTIP